MTGIIVGISEPCLERYLFFSLSGWTIFEEVENTKKERLNYQTN
jgi:hypothetical protein